MCKKIYNQPSIEVAMFNASNIINTSTGSATTFSINDEYVDDEPESSTSSDIWGKQL